MRQKVGYYWGTIACISNKMVLVNIVSGRTEKFHKDSLKPEPTLIGQCWEQHPFILVPDWYAECARENFRNESLSL
jgi:hypothetical protein